MKYIFKYGFFIALLSLNIPASAKVVHSLDQIPAQIHNEDAFGSSFWSTGTTLRPNDLIKIIAPQDINDRWSLVGMKAWPGQKDRYIVVACSTKSSQKELDTDQKNSCSAEENSTGKVIVAVVDYNSSGMPKLVAEPYIEDMSSDTDNETGVVNENALKNNAFDLINDSGSSTIGDLKRLDFAHYQLNSTTIAFGIRFESQNMYPRGDVTNQ